MNSTIDASCGKQCDVGPFRAATGAKYIAAACSNCKRQLTQLMEHYKEDVAVGGVHDMLSRSILINGKAAERTNYEE